MAQEREDYSEKLLASVNEAAAAVSTRFVTFVSVAAYVAVTVASTTHEMLLRATNLVTLPLLNAQIPIIGAFGFYTIAPWLIVLLHSDLLLQLSILANELTRFEQEVSRCSDDKRALLRQRVANFYYVLYLTRQAPSRFLHLLSGFITWVTAVAIPLGLLLWIQIRFLPFHSDTDTWLHRAAVVADAMLVVFVLLPRFAPHFPSRQTGPGWRALLDRMVAARTLVVLGCALTVGFSLLVVTIPRGAAGGKTWFAHNMDLRERVLVSNVLSPEDVNALRDSNQPQQLRQVLAKVAPLYALQGRDFRYANLNNAVLPGLDLRALRSDDGGDAKPAPPECDYRRSCEDPPQCENPSIRRTELTGVDLGWASMQKAMFDEAVLEGANLGWARIQYGSFAGAHMNRAILACAKLQEARFGSAKLCGADLREAELQQAVFSDASLQGASLQKARLIKANLERADLRGADLSEADLTDANLRDAQLQGAVLRGAVTRGAVFDGAIIDLSDLSAATAARDGAVPSGVNAYLAGLACASPAAAYGIARQALHSPARDGHGLARALLDARSRPECAGLAALESATIAELEQLAQP